MSSHSEYQEMLKGSPSNTMSQEIDSKATGSEMYGEETNKMELNLSQKPLDAQAINGFKDGLSERNGSNSSVNVDTQQLSKFSIEDTSKGSFINDNALSVSMEETEDVQVSLQASNTCKEDNESLKLLSEKLSAALENVSLKDDLVKQHSKVAEEAVAGWEKAEKEVATMKLQLEDAVQKSSALEARVSHLDEALKECVRQLRLARDEQERKINQAVTEKTNVLESAKTRLEEQLVELQALVENSRLNSPNQECQHRIEFLEKENVLFRQELQSLREELEVRTIERDLSTNAAETASKQHLESIKKVARLEAECRKLKSLSRVSSVGNENKSGTAATSCVESLIDCHSDGAEQLSASECESHKMNGSWASALITELDQFKCEKVTDKNMLSSSMNINLMDDFLEMERLAALPDSLPQVHSIGYNEIPEKPLHEADSRLRIELETMACRTAKLEEDISKVETDKAKLAMALAQYQSCLDESQLQLIDTQMKLEQVEREFHEATEEKIYYKTIAESVDGEAKLMSSQIKTLRVEIEREQALSKQKSTRCKELKNELKIKEEEMQIQLDAIASCDMKMKEMALVQTQDSLEKSEAQLQEAERKLKELEKELQDANDEKESLNSELDSVREELRTMSSQIESLNEQVQKEQALAAELSTKLQEMENELQIKTLELDAQQRARSNNELMIKQEDLAIAAEKLADCQQTIASLGSQLQSLATLEDFLTETANISGLSPHAPLMAKRSGQPWKLHSNDTYLSEKEYEPLNDVQEDLSPFASHNRRDTRGSPASSSLSANSTAFFMNHPGPEKNGNGFAHYFPISRS